MHHDLGRIPNAHDRGPSLWPPRPIGIWLADPEMKERLVLIEEDNEMVLWVGNELKAHAYLDKVMLANQAVHSTRKPCCAVAVKYTNYNSVAVELIGTAEDGLWVDDLSLTERILGQVKFQQLAYFLAEADKLPKDRIPFPSQN